MILNPSPPVGGFRPFYPCRYRLQTAPARPWRRSLAQCLYAAWLGVLYGIGNRLLRYAVQL